MVKNCGQNGSAQNALVVIIIIVIIIIIIIIIGVVVINGRELRSEWQRSNALLIRSSVPSL